MALKDFIAWLNIKEYKLMPIEILKGILANIIVVCFTPPVFFILLIFISLILGIFQILGFTLPSSIISQMSQNGLTLSSMIFIISPIVPAFFIGYLYGRFKGDETSDHVVFKNFTFGFFIIIFLMG